MLDENATAQHPEQLRGVSGLEYGTKALTASAASPGSASEKATAATKVAKAHHANQKPQALIDREGKTQAVYGSKDNGYVAVDAKFDKSGAIDANATRDAQVQYLAGYVQSQTATNEGVQYEQKESSYLAGIKKEYTETNGVYDLTGGDTKTTTDAAMLSSLGTEVGEKGSGVYEFGGQKFNTGMSQEQAREVLHTRGISGVHTEANDNGTNQVVYSQHTPTSNNQMLESTSRAHNGNAIAKYNTNIGSANGPQSWTTDGQGGGTMTFANQNAAARYFQQSGNIQLAESISSAKQGKDISDGVRTVSVGNGGQVSINFNGRALAEQGIKMQNSDDGKDMYVSSSDNTFKDPFATTGPMLEVGQQSPQPTTQNNNQQNPQPTTQNNP
jgi:hypothetical protein